MIVGIEDAAEEIHEKATQFDHLMCLIKGKVLSCKTSCEKIQYLTLFPSQLINVVTIPRFIQKSTGFAKENGVLSLTLQKKRK